MTDIYSKVLSKPEYTNLLARNGSDVNRILNFIKYVNVSLSEHVDNYRFKPTTGGITSTSTIIPNMAIPSISAIRFNKNMFANTNNWQNYAGYAILLGHFLPIDDKTPAYMVAVHELGHHCFTHLKSFATFEEIQTMNKAFDKRNLNNLFNQKEISKYAKKSMDEHAAECFSNIFCRGENATEHNKKLFKTFEAIYNRIYGLK